MEIGCGVCGVWEFSRTTLDVSSMNKAYISKSLLDNPGATFCGATPNNSVYLAPIGWDITRKTVLTTKPYARLVIKITQLVVFLNVLQNRNRVICFADFRQRNKSTNQNQLLFFYSISILFILRIQIQSNLIFINLVDNFYSQEGTWMPGARLGIRWIRPLY